MAPRRRTDTHLVTRIDRSGAKRSPDELIVEEPMTIQLDGHRVATTMRTPGHDYELAAGFCHTDGLLGGARIIGVRYCADGAASESEFNVVTVETGGRAPVPTPRLGNTTSSCGLCGSEAIDQLCDALSPLPDTEPIPLHVLAAVPDAVLGSQGLFTSTGAVHAAAAVAPDGTVLVLREDVGRHNAVDKVLGARLRRGTPLSEHDDETLVVSSRAGFEIVQKAVAGRVPVVLTVGAATSLADALARAANVRLFSFVRDAGFNRHGDG